jgi:hypothetical protein
MEMYNEKKEKVEEMFFELYERYSLPVKYLEHFELLFEKYWDKEPKRVVRFVYILKSTTSQMCTSDYILDELLELLGMYAFLFEDEICSLLMDAIHREKAGTVYSNIKKMTLAEKQEILQERDKTLRFAYLNMFAVYEEDRKFLAEKLEILLEDSDNYMEIIEKQGREFGQKLSLMSCVALKKGEEKNIRNEIKILTYICRKTQVSFSEINENYGVDRYWLRKRVLLWLKMNLVKVKFYKKNILQVNSTKKLPKYLKGFLKDKNTDIALLHENGEIKRIDPNLRNVFSDLDYIVRNEGKN